MNILNKPLFFGSEQQGIDFILENYYQIVMRKALSCLLFQIPLFCTLLKACTFFKLFFKLYLKIFILKI